MYAATIFSVTIFISFRLNGAEMSAWSVYEVLSERIESELSLLRRELSSTKEELRLNKEGLECLKERCSTVSPLPDDKRTDGRSLRPANTDDIQMHSVLKRGFSTEKMKLRKSTKQVVKAIKDVEANMTSFKDDIKTMMNQNIAYVEAKWTQETEKIAQGLKRVDDQQKRSDIEMHHVKRRAEENYGAIAHLKKEVPQTSENVSNLWEKHKQLYQAVTDHLSTYQNKIANAVQNHEKCQSGTVEVHLVRDHLSSDTRMVHFKPPFRNTPTVTLGTNGLDISTKANIRYNANIKSLSRTGFQVVMHTWADTAIYWLGVRWMACPN